MTRTEVIAEIGWNHMGNMDLAKKMIQAAAGAGADYAKFQYWRESKLKSGPWDKDGRREIYQKAQLSMAQLRELQFICNESGIKFLCSIFDASDIKDLAKISDCIKIPSHEATNYPLISEAVDRFKYVYISLGATTADEKEHIRKEFKKESDRIAIMYCVSSYPMSLHNFKMDTFKVMLRRFRATGYRVGYSGHHSTIYDAIMAMAYDIDVVEKHFTTDNTLPGRDNQFALSPKELEDLCWIREEMELGFPSDSYGYLPEEQEVRDVYRGRWSKRNY